MVVDIRIVFVRLTLLKSVYWVGPNFGARKSTTAHDEIKSEQVDL